MNMPRCSLFLAICGLLLGGCVSAPTQPSDRQLLLANAVEDVIAVGLVPVLAKNSSYLPLARSMAVVISTTFGGTTVREEDVAAILAKTSVSPEDARVITGLVMAAWDTYSRRYAEQVSSTVRPDVKLFVQAVANGINRAVAVTPAK